MSTNAWLACFLQSVDPLFNTILGSRDDEDFPYQPQPGHRITSLVLGLHSNAALQKIRHLCAMDREVYALLVSISVINNGLQTSSEDQTLAITRHGPLDNEDLCPQAVFSDPKLTCSGPN